MPFDRGDLVLLLFPYTDGSGAKQRPALVLLDTGDDDILVARVTTHPAGSEFDSVIVNWSVAGFLAPSTVRLHKLATIPRCRQARRRRYLNGWFRTWPWHFRESTLVRKYAVVNPVSFGPEFPCGCWNGPAAWGASEQALLAAYPSLRAEDLVNAWAYARAHAPEIEAQIRGNEAA